MKCKWVNVDALKGFEADFEEKWLKGKFHLKVNPCGWLNGTWIGSTNSYRGVHRGASCMFCFFLFLFFFERQKRVGGGGDCGLATTLAIVVCII